MLRQQAKINHPNKLLQEKEKQLLVIDKKEPNVSIFLIDLLVVIHKHNKRRLYGWPLFF